ncbi:MAG: AraC family transcriptional regulator [Myxococcota bacterium]
MAALGVAALDAYQMRLLGLSVVPLAAGFASDASGPAPWTLSVSTGTGATLHLGSRVIALPPGRVVLIPPAASGAKTDGDVMQLRVHFQPSAAAAEQADALGPEPLVLEPDELRDALCARLRRDIESGRALGAATCARVKALVHLSVAAAFELGGDALHEPKLADDAERQLRPVLRYIDAHLAEPLENARLAAFVHASESHFIRMFRRVLGCTPARHVQERRVSHAAELLARTNLTIDEIAERCGFANRFHFSRVFAQRMAEPPGRYRVLHGSRTATDAGPAT